LSRWR